MGLEVVFKRVEAEKAGMEFTVDDGVWVTSIPGVDHLVPDFGCDTNVVINANKWERVYQPLTEWLRAAGIEWSED